MGRFLSAILVVTGAFLSQPSEAQDIAEPVMRPELPKEWSRAVRGFRREHHFSLSYGLVNNHWRGNLSQDETRFSFENTGHQARLSYAFHLPLLGGFGYYLGTQASAMFALSSKNNQGGELSYGLPGLSAGFVYNLADQLRVGSGVEFGWQRVEKLGLPEAWSRKKISVTGETRAWQGQIDYFYELSWALQLVFESTELSYKPAESLSLSKVSQTWSLGILKHLI
jgi:hypothetical protein